MRILKRLALIAIVGLLCLVVLGLAAGGIAYWLIEPRVPSVASLKDVQMQVPLRVLSADGKLIAEFGETRRIPVDINNVPKNLKNAVLAAEDADFYHHSGIDVTSTFRAAVEVVLHRGEKVQGGSTITQQVARNFFLSPQKTYTRKFTEILTSFRIESELSKDQILQLYLNKMFLGNRAYGVAAAAQYYYGKTIDQLTLAECAAIASTFQLPSAVNPTDNKPRLIARRNWVLGQMLSHQFIDPSEYRQAIAAPDDASPHEPPVQVDAPYLAEMVRQQALQKFGNRAQTDGYVIRTTIDSRMQALANHALRSRLEDYDHRHGYRGPEAHVPLPQSMTPATLEKALSGYGDLSGLLPALVTAVDTHAARVYVQGTGSITLPEADMKWALGYARKAKTGGKGAASILQPGDVIRVRDVPDQDTPARATPAKVAKDKGTEGAVAADPHHWELQQVPAAQAAMVVLSPDDGAVKALVGGFNFRSSKFNRAVQTARQPGSSFKPFIYSAAFSRGYTPASIINDAPIALPDPSKPGGLWTPQNDDGKFRGPMRLREGLAQSVNLVAIRLLDAVGVRYTREYATRFGFPLDAIPANLSMALGTASVSPMAMARAYAVFANGGFLINPYYVAEIDDRNGKAVYKADPVQACRTCEARLLDEGKTTAAPTQPPAAAGDPGAMADTANALARGESKGPLLAPRVIDPRNDFLTTSLLHSVIDHGTGAAVKKLGRSDLAGKTGSTNDHHDGWFCGFNSDLVATVWVGFDDYRSLGRGEFGAKTALPIWMAFMGPALEGKPEAALPMPPGIVTATIDRDTGLPAPPGDTNTMTEIFRIENLDRLRAEAKAQQNKAPAYDIF
ncbi:MAG TPA: penicillin-binding protein 1A [Rhodanobacteraceae bacterium]|jgi:penicillin-binding protein 1A|nr:penicillin-binding protein 1A [Rhodanobacteraceae bacterium]